MRLILSSLLVSLWVTSSFALEFETKRITNRGYSNTPYWYEYNAFGEYKRLCPANEKVADFLVALKVDWFALCDLKLMNEDKCIRVYDIKNCNEM